MLFKIQEDLKYCKRPCSLVYTYVSRETLYKHYSRLQNTVFCLGDEFALLRVYNRKMNYIEKYPAKFGEILKMYKYWLNL